MERLGEGKGRALAGHRPITVSLTKIDRRAGRRVPIKDPIHAGGNMLANDLVRASSVLF
jgi:hypothetical protein